MSTHKRKASWVIRRLREEANDLVNGLEFDDDPRQTVFDLWVSLSRQLTQDLKFTRQELAKKIRPYNS